MVSSIKLLPDAFCREVDLTMISHEADPPDLIVISPSRMLEASDLESTLMLLLVFAARLAASTTSAVACAITVTCACNVAENKVVRITADIMWNKFFMLLFFLIQMYTKKFTMQEKCKKIFYRR